MKKKLTAPINLIFNYDFALTVVILANRFHNKKKNFLHVALSKMHRGPSMFKSIFNYNFEQINLSIPVTFHLLRVANIQDSVIMQSPLEVNQIMR